MVGLFTVLFLEQGSTGAEASSSTQIARADGVGALHLGDTVRSLQRRHLIRRLHPGCELDPGQRVARLRAPLNGFAVFTHPNTRLSSIQVLAGAETAKHIGIGSTPGQARSAYPRARYQPPGTVDPFAEGFIWVNRPSHPKLTFIVDPDSNLISEISVHSPNFCE
jgi:hypothetical protein